MRFNSTTRRLYWYLIWASSTAGSLLSSSARLWRRATPAPTVDSPFLEEPRRKFSLLLWVPAHVGIFKNLFLLNISNWLRGNAFSRTSRCNRPLRSWALETCTTIRGHLGTFIEVISSQYMNLFRWLNRTRDVKFIVVNFDETEDMTVLEMDAIDRPTKTTSAHNGMERFCQHQEAIRWWFGSFHKVCQPLNPREWNTIGHVRVFSNFCCSWKGWEVATIVGHTTCE